MCYRKRIRRDRHSRNNKIMTTYNELRKILDNLNFPNINEVWISLLHEMSDYSLIDCAIIVSDIQAGAIFYYWKTPVYSREIFEDLQIDVKDFIKQFRKATQKELDEMDISEIIE